MELNFGEVFKIFLWAMRPLDLLSHIKRDVKWKLIYILKNTVVTIIFILVIYNIFFVNLKRNDFSQICKNGTLFVVYIQMVSMHIIYFWKEKYIVSLLNDLKKDYESYKEMPLKEQEVMQEYAKRTRLSYKVWFVSASLCLMVFPIVNAFLLAFYWMKGEFHFIPLYDLEYPAMIEDNKDTWFIFILTYLSTFSYGAFPTLTFIALVPLGPAFMLHACGQLGVVKLRIEALFQNNDIEEVRNGLNGVVKKLQYIYSIADRINICFRLVYEVTFKVTTIILPITCYEVLGTLKRRELSLEFVMFIFGAIILNSILCVYGDALMEKGEDLRQAVYTCGWEKVYDRGIRSTISLILLRTQRPIAIRSQFRIVRLMLLTDLADQSFKLFNLMNAVWE